MIDPMSAAEITATLIGLNTELVSQSMADAYNSRITGTYDTDSGPAIGFADYTSNKPAITGQTSNTVSDSQEPVAVDAWHDYVENEVTQVSDVTGGIVSGSDVGTFVYSLLEEHPGTAEAVVKAVAPVAVPIQAAIVAASQALGVSMNISEISEEIRDQLVNSVKSTAGAIYDSAKNTVTAWKDSLGRILFPKRVLETVSETLEELGIGGDGSGTATYLGRRVTYFTSLGATENYKGVWGEYICRTGEQFATVYSFSNPVGYTIDSSDNVVTFYKNQQYTYGGRTLYGYGPLPGGNLYAIPDVDEYYDAQQTASALLLGVLTPSGDYPEGTEASEADSYTPSSIPVAGNIATSYDPDTGILGYEEVVPIQLTEDPYNSIGSTDDPTDPTNDGNPGVLTPPIPLPIPDTNVTNPDVPLTNPTIVNAALVSELVNELAETLDPQPPQSSGLIPVPPLPGIIDPITGESSYPSIVPASGSGLVHVYNPTPGEFVSFGNWLWVTYADATIDKIWNNPFDGIVGAHELYATPQTDGSDNIRSGFLVCPTTAALVRQRYTEIDCGTIIVPEFYGNYLDYSPYSQAYIYLPFIGINEVSIDDIVGHAINLRYRVDAYNGSCIAMIFVAKDGYQNLCYQFAGNCAVEVPLAGGSQAAIKAGMMQAEAYARSGMLQAAGNLLGGFGSALLGNLGGVLSSFGGIVSNYANAAAGIESARVANKSTVQHSGQFGASHGAMGNKTPFIIIRNPIQVKVVNYNDDYGFPAHKRVIVGGCRGYLRVREVNVISAHATDEEKMAIEIALKNGVYVS